jgi:hypothetical protein
MKLPLSRSDEKQPINQKTAMLIAVFFTALILLRGDQYYSIDMLPTTGHEITPQ